MGRNIERGLTTWGVARVHILDAARLESDGTWGVVRFAANPPGDASQDLLAELQRDRKISSSQLERISEAIVNDTIPNTGKRERKTAAQIMVDHGRKLGRAEGERLGRAEGHERGRIGLLQQIAQATLSPDAIDALGSDPSLEDLERALAGRVPGL